MHVFVSRIIIILLLFSYSPKRHILNWECNCFQMITSWRLQFSSFCIYHWIAVWNEQSNSKWTMYWTGAVWSCSLPVVLKCVLISCSSPSVPHGGGKCSSNGWKPDQPLTEQVHLYSLIMCMIHVIRPTNSDEMEDFLKLFL